MTCAAGTSSPKPRSARPRGAPVDPAPRPAEVTTLHTRILRCTLAVDDSYAYWQRVDPVIPQVERARHAFEQRWFGTKSEARIRTFMTDMVERFDAYPEAFALLRQLGTVPSNQRPLICHLHTQLADPLYRRFTGEMLPTRRAHGQSTIDREVVAQWIESLTSDRWSLGTRLKFGSNLLATAADAGLVSGNKDPRRLVAPNVPDWALGYALYLLRDIQIDGSLDHNPYLRSLGVSSETFGRLESRVPGLRITQLGGVFDITWLEPSLLEWGLRYLGGRQ